MTDATRRAPDAPAGDSPEECAADTIDMIWTRRCNEHGLNPCRACAKICVARILKAHEDIARAAGYREGVEAAAKVVERGGCTCGCAGDIRALSPAPVADAGADAPNKEAGK